MWKLNLKDWFKTEPIVIKPKRDFNKDYNEAFTNGMQAFRDGKEYGAPANPYYDLNLYPNDKYRNVLLYAEWSHGWWYEMEKKEKEDRLLEIEQLKAENWRLKNGI